MKVIVLTIWQSHDDSRTTSLHTTWVGARQALRWWVEDAWDNEAMGRDVAELDGNNWLEMIEYFFDLMADDYQYNITEETVRGPTVAKEVPELAPDEVSLSPEEVAATVYALETVQVRGVIRRLGLDSKADLSKCLSLVVGVSEKLRD